jgi:hypothetical protein
MIVEESENDEGRRPDAAHAKSLGRSKNPIVKAFPERLYMSIGGYFGPSYQVTLENDRLIYRYWPPRESCFREPEPQSEKIQPSAKQWQAFRRALDRLDVWRWQADYPNSAVCDGTAWSVEIAYSDRSLVSSGDNCFPGRDGRALPVTADGKDSTFAKFCHAVARLIGRQFE